jgi:hypothetical protein
MYDVLLFVVRCLYGGNGDVDDGAAWETLL